MKSRNATLVFFVIALLTASTIAASVRSYSPVDEIGLLSGDEYPFEDHYPSVAELYEWYDDLILEYPDLVSKIHIGYSWEGRDLWVLEITSEEDVMVDEKPEILIDGAMHAREWSSTQAACYLMWRLLREYEYNETIYWLLNNRVIYIMPMQNPDGYIFDGDGVYSDRGGWRKNRNDSTPTTAVGVDLNRNWDISWEGGSDSPSSNLYRGVAPFSEYENRYLRDFILSKNIQSYQNIHSYHGSLLIPLLYSTDPSPHDEWYRGMASHMTSMTSRLGDDSWNYDYGQAHEMIGYTATGGAADWVYANVGAHSLVYEIHTGGSGIGGFYPATSDIMTINQDIDDSLIYQCRVADTDLGDGTDLLFPPIPYIVYGVITDINDIPVIGTEVTIENTDTFESISINTDNNGYYELNFGNLVEYGYSSTDTFLISVSNEHFEFTIGDEWGQRIDKEVILEGEPPEIILETPVGGEVWGAHTTEDILWTTEEGDDTIDRVDIWYSIDGGSSWYTIASGIDDTGSHNWVIPNEPTTEGIVRIRAIDQVGRWSTDESGGYFEIVGVRPLPPSNLEVEHTGASGVQELFAEDFTGVSGIPDGWTEVPTGRWETINDNRAGGTAPELRFARSPYTTNTFRVYTPAIDTTGYTELELSFAHFMDDSGSRYSIRVETSSDGENWDTIWSLSPSGNVGPETVTIDFSDNVGSETLHIAWTLDGNTFDVGFYRWNIDDIVLTGEGGEGTEHNLLTWDASTDDPDEVAQYNIYRSSTYDGTYEYVESVAADGSMNYSYIDVNMGAANETLWWYIVRAEGTNGLEDKNTNAVREPGHMHTFDVPLIAGGAADGWNFVSFIVIPRSDNLENLMVGFDDIYERIMYFDSSLGKWHSYVPGRADRYNDMDSWNHLMGVWIRVMEDATLTVEGYLPDITEVTLYPGWNMVGLPSSEAGNHDLPEVITKIGYFDASADHNIVYSFETAYYIFESGNGYWLYSDADEAVVWTVRMDQY